jgi:hypothetical protein
MHELRGLPTCVCCLSACHIGTHARQQAAKEMNARCRMVAGSLRGAWRPARIGSTYAAAMAAHSSQGLQPMVCGGYQEATTPVTSGGVVTWRAGMLEGASLLDQL